MGEFSSPVPEDAASNKQEAASSWTLFVSVSGAGGERRNTRWRTHFSRLHANIYTFPWNSRYWLSWREWNPSVPRGGRASATPFLTFPGSRLRGPNTRPEPDTAPMANVSPRIGKEITVWNKSRTSECEKWIAFVQWFCRNEIIPPREICLYLARVVFSPPFLSSWNEKWLRFDNMIVKVG